MIKYGKYYYVIRKWNNFKKVPHQKINLHQKRIVLKDTIILKIPDLYAHLKWKNDIMKKNLIDIYYN